jgi:hypothetical protein
MAPPYVLDIELISAGERGGNSEARKPSNNDLANRKLSTVILSGLLVERTAKM